MMLTRLVTILTLGLVAATTACSAPEPVHADLETCLDMAYAAEEELSILERAATINGRAGTASEQRTLHALQAVRKTKADLVAEAGLTDEEAATRHTARTDTFFQKFDNPNTLVLGIAKEVQACAASIA